MEDNKKIDQMIEKLNDIKLFLTNTNSNNINDKLSNAIFNTIKDIKDQTQITKTKNDNLNYTQSLIFSKLQTQSSRNTNYPGSQVFSNNFIPTFKNFDRNNKTTTINPIIQPFSIENEFNKLNSIFRQNYLNTDIRNTMMDNQIPQNLVSQNIFSNNLSNQFLPYYNRRAEQNQLNPRNIGDTSLSLATQNVFDNPKDDNAIKLLKKIYQQLTISNESLKSISKNISLIEMEDETNEHEKQLKESNELARINERHEEILAEKYSTDQNIHNKNDSETGISIFDKTIAGILAKQALKKVTGVAAGAAAEGAAGAAAEAGAVGAAGAAGAAEAAEAGAAAAAAAGAAAEASRTRAGRVAKSLAKKLSRFPKGLGLGGPIGIAAGATIIAGHLATQGYLKTFNGAEDIYYKLTQDGTINYWTGEIEDWDSIKELPKNELELLLNSGKFSDAENQRLSYFIRLKSGNFATQQSQKIDEKKSSWSPITIKSPRKNNKVESNNKIENNNYTDSYPRVIRDPVTGEETRLYPDDQASDLNDTGKNKNNINIDTLSINELKVEKFSVNEFSSGQSQQMSYSPTNKSSTPQNIIQTDYNPATPNFSNVKGQPTSKNQKDFYNSIYSSLLSYAKEKGVSNPEVIAHLGASQASLETGYGKHTLGSANNAFGIKAQEGEESVTINEKEFINGQFVTRPEKFKKYASVGESTKDWLDFMIRNKRYKGVLNAKTVEEAIAEQGRSGYATDPDYDIKAMGVYKSNIGANASNILIPKEELASLKTNIGTNTIPSQKSQLDKLTETIVSTKSMAEASIKSSLNLASSKQPTQQKLQNQAPNVSAMMNVRNDDPLLLTLQYGNIRTV